MKILVVDDEQSFGKLLGHTLKRLGHKPVVTTHPQDALELLTDDVDAVITDIEMPGMNGIELAKAIREKRDQMPIAFCTGSAPEGEVQRAASEIGTVLPKVWTVADVKQVVEGLRAPLEPPTRRRSPSPVAHLYTDVQSEPGSPAPAEPPARKRRKVRMAFRSWDQVMRLCADAMRGRVRITVPGPKDLAPGDPIAIALVLPEEITVKIAGAVRALRPRDGERPDVVIELKGLTDELCGRLEMLASASVTPTPRPVAYGEPSGRSRTPKGTPPDSLARGSQEQMSVNDILTGSNNRLRRQIEGLPARMQPPRDDEEG